MDILRAPKLYELVLEKIFEWIRRGEVRPGDMFPPERELEKQLGVSRAVLREAFHVLEFRGLVCSKHGKGRFLRRIDDGEVESYLGSAYLLRKLESAALLDLYEVRIDLESGAVRMVADRATDEEIGEIKSLYEAKCLEWKTIGLVGTDFELHKAYAEMCHNVMWRQLIDLQLSLVSDFSAPEFWNLIVANRAEQYVEDHGTIVRHLVSRDGDGAAEAMKAHIERMVVLLRAV